MRGQRPLIVSNSRTWPCLQNEILGTPDLPSVLPYANVTDLALETPVWLQSEESSFLVIGRVGFTCLLNLLEIRAVHLYM